VILDYVCRPIGGVARAGGDADAVAFADPVTMDAYALTEAARRVIRRALDLDPSRENSGR
jgi:hypothetical protein